MAVYMIINGPNLNLIGTRETDVYGDITFDEFIPVLREENPEHRIEFFQSNHEGAIIDKIQEAGFGTDGIILNPGAYTHTSIAIADAVRSIALPVIEVHLSDINAREEYRRVSYIRPHCKACFMGKGMEGYRLALQSLLDV